jgi:hypothetical protein
VDVCDIWGMRDQSGPNNKRRRMLSFLEMCFFPYSMHTSLTGLWTGMF